MLIRHIWILYKNFSVGVQIQLRCLHLVLLKQVVAMTQKFYVPRKWAKSSPTVCLWCICTRENCVWMNAMIRGTPLGYVGTGIARQIIQALYSASYKMFSRKYCTLVLTELCFLSKRVFLNLSSYHALRSTGDCSSSELGRFVLVTEMLVTHSLFSSPCWEHCIQFQTPPSKEDTSGEVGLGLELCEGAEGRAGNGYDHLQANGQHLHRGEGGDGVRPMVHGRGWGTEMRDAQAGQSPDWPSLSSGLTLHCAAVLTRAHLWSLPTSSYDPKSLSSN